MSTALFRRTLLASVVVVLPLASQAQTSRYQSWSAPGASTRAQGDTQKLLKDLGALVDEAEKARAADKVFLRDLRDLMARYGQGAAPGLSRVLFDDFADGDFTHNPVWSVATGEYWVEQGYGLRSKSVTAAIGSGSSGSTGAKVSKEQLALSILGAVLQGANKNKTNADTAPAPTKAEPAVLSTRQRISNAFGVNLDLSSWKGEGRFGVAVTQGTGSAGYRAIYTPKQGARGATLELVRLTSRGAAVIDTTSITALEDQKNHSLQWIRAADGQMTVNLDGKKVLSARDTSFRDPFDGLALLNDGADVIVKSVEVSGTQ